MADADVVIAASGGYLVPAAVLVESVVEDGHFDGTIVVLVSPDERGLGLKVLAATAARVGARIVIRPVPESLRFPLKPTTSPSSCYRFFAPVLCDAERILYLDADTLVRKPLHELLETDLGGLPLAAVEDPFRRLSRLRSFDGYLNSGVLLIDSARWQAARITERAARFLESAGRRVVRFWDQDALNAAVDGRWTRLHPKWNAVPPAQVRSFPLCGQTTEAALRQLVPEHDVGIHHFVGPRKPWLPGCADLDLARRYATIAQSYRSAKPASSSSTEVASDGNQLSSAELQDRLDGGTSSEAV